MENDIKLGSILKETFEVFSVNIIPILLLSVPLHIAYLFGWPILEKFLYLNTRISGFFGEYTYPVFNAVFSGLVEAITAVLVMWYLTRKSFHVSRKKLLTIVTVWTAILIILYLPGEYLDQVEDQYSKMIPATLSTLIAFFLLIRLSLVVPVCFYEQKQGLKQSLMKSHILIIGYGWLFFASIMMFGIAMAVAFYLQDLFYVDEPEWLNDIFSSLITGMSSSLSAVLALTWYRHLSGEAGVNSKDSIRQIFE
ncbi:hypothetical protein [Kordiimonas sp. SCSIO 12610]|uniref:hypothetical protein n=1 Tax=Kordiimonas sp. SCSIO 12610 TaxID=2829597 RepID=UPI0021092836|nr:hypothetical protein [Kordiimonas sp. SCSIO 12610]UTW56325.1 hypothetical protein KFF44_05325 [Kordiimonas sp. SCSIO 12610]